MNLNDKQLNLMKRIITGREGDEFLALLKEYEADAMRRSITENEVASRWQQGKAKAFEEIFNDLVASRSR